MATSRKHSSSITLDTTTNESASATLVLDTAPACRAVWNGVVLSVTNGLVTKVTTNKRQDGKGSYTMASVNIGSNESIVIFRDDIAEGDIISVRMVLNTGTGRMSPLPGSFVLEGRVAGK
jgi:hypothetical protein